MVLPGSGDGGELDDLFPRFPLKKKIGGWSETGARCLGGGHPWVCSVQALLMEETGL